MAGMGSRKATLFSNCFIGEEMLFKIEICARPERGKLQEKLAASGMYGLIIMSFSVPKSRVDSNHHFRIRAMIQKCINLWLYLSWDGLNPTKLPVRTCGMSMETVLNSHNSLSFPSHSCRLPFLLVPAFMWKIVASETTYAQPAENAPFWVLAASSQYLLLVDSCLQCNFGEQKCYWPERETKLLFKATRAPKQNKQSVGQLPCYFSVDFLGFFPCQTAASQSKRQNHQVGVSPALNIS